jgi:ribosome modulation factor
VSVSASSPPSIFHAFADAQRAHMGTPAWNKGYQDYLSKKDQAQNPYTDPDERADWETGAQRAKKEEYSDFGSSD